MCIRDRFSFDFISINACTFDGIEDDKDAIRILKYHTMDNFFLKTMKEEMMEKVNLEKRASLLSLEKIFSLLSKYRKKQMILMFWSKSMMSYYVRV